MIRVVDTSLWIELIAEGPLSSVAEELLTPFASCFVPAVVYYELVKICHRKLGPERAQQIQSLLTKCEFVPLNKSIAAEAATLSIAHKLHATDALIYATARLLAVPLATCDAHFEGLEGVDYRPKTQ